MKIVGDHLFDAGSLESWFYVEDGNYVDSSSAVVFLPFCAIFLIGIESAIDEFIERFMIRFLKKGELGEHVLWKSLCDDKPLYDNMSAVFGKKPDQEEEWCKHNYQELKQLEESSYNQRVISLIEWIDGVEDVRIIKLTALHNQMENSIVDQTTVVRP
jgi:hypothetical protein